MPNIAERLIELRERNHLSQTEVARRIGVTPALISAYERNERKPSIDNLIALSDTFQTTTDYILGKSRTNNSSILLDVTHLSEEQIKILRDLINDMSQR